MFVNLTTVLFLGGKALDTIVGVGDGSIILNSIIGLSLFALAYSLWGGLASVAWTDVIQVIILIFGGLLMTYFALTNVTDSGGVIDGLKHVFENMTFKPIFILFIRTFPILPFSLGSYLIALSEIKKRFIIVYSLFGAYFYYFSLFFIIQSA